MAIDIRQQEFRVERDDAKCIRCEVCVRQCPFEVHCYDKKNDVMKEDNSKCVGCHRCETYCPTDAITIKKTEREYRSNGNWSASHINAIKKQARGGGMLLTGMGSDRKIKSYFDHILLDASQVTNPSIDPLREPMELRTYLGRKADKVMLEYNDTEDIRIAADIGPQLQAETPILFSAMSYGSVSLNVCKSLAAAAEQIGTFYNTGEGGLHKSLEKYGANTIVQVASGRFGVDADYLNAGAAIEIKIGQGAKPGIGGHLPGEKVSEDVSQTRMIPVGSDAISPAPHHDIYSIEDLRQLIYALKEASDYTKPVSVKISAVHNSAAIASGMVRAGADIIALDGIRGGTGAAPNVVRDHTGIPIELAIAAVDQRLRDEGIRNQASVIAAGGFRDAADIVKGIALGADAVYVATSALIAMGCTQCQKCYTGKCPWGLTTQDPYLVKRLNPEIGTRSAVNLVRGWSLEIKEVLGSMGLNAVESLRGNRERLRSVGLSDRENEILGVKPAGV